MHVSSSYGHGDVWLLARKRTLSAAGSIPSLALGDGRISFSLLKQQHQNPFFGAYCEHVKFHNKSIVNNKSY